MADVSISFESGVTYPANEEYLPQRTFPEYPFKFSLAGKNKPYELVRRCLQHFGADREHYDTPAWNPLGQWIKKDDRVFILPNLVAHRRSGQSTESFLAKCTHASIVSALLDYIFIATSSLNHVTLGSAPLQSCDYERVTRDTGITRIVQFYREVANADITPHDLRCVISKWSRWGILLERREQKTDEAVLIDLGKQSLLEELFHKPNGLVRIRVGDYDPRETMSYHSPGRHIYVVNKRVLEANVIISVPKIKTHQKVGITCALKGTVGVIARKECLAHHRKGGLKENGDEYPQTNFLRKLTSDLADRGDSTDNPILANNIRFISKVLGRALHIGKSGILGGNWYGNDTAWRMALDIARILRYARPDGTISNTPVRHHLALVDGIVAGEGEGPLKPRPRKMGVILFSPDICSVDAACALVMGYDPYRIPLVRNSFLKMPFRLTDDPLEDLCLILNGQRVSASDILRQFNSPFLAPKGWRGAIEANGKVSVKYK